ncbi:MAG: adenosylhomocysteinase [Chloroflexota bacterium]
MSRLEWVDASMRVLRAVGDELATTRPFDGMVIGTGIHLEPKTAALLLALRRGGAEVVATGNLNSTQPETVDYLRAHGIRVIGTRTQDASAHVADLDAVLDAEPHLLLDNGGDLFARWLERPYERLLGGTEETTSGRRRLTPLRDRLARPILVINDSPIKQFAENEHAVGQSVVESFMRITNRSTNGRRVTVFGYGPCGRGVAANFRNNHAAVSVVEVDPVLRLQALLDGFAVPERDAALASADIVLTVTGARNVVTAADLGDLRDGVIMANAGHFPYEIDVAGMAADGSVAERQEATDGIGTLRLDDGRSVNILADGHMVNLAGPRPLGNSIEAMDLGFALQARCLAAVASGAVGAESCVVPVPRAIDEAVASAFVALAANG